MAEGLVDTKDTRDPAALTDDEILAELQKIEKLTDDELVRVYRDCVVGHVWFASMCVDRNKFAGPSPMYSLISSRYGLVHGWR